MPETLSELLNGGVVTARHPAFLRPGELQRADDCVYREKDPALWRAPGRQKRNALALGSVWAGAAAGVKGLAHLSFERSRYDQLLVYSGTVFARAALTASSAPTIDAIDLQLTCVTTSASTTVTSAALFGPVQAGWDVVGTGIPAGCQVKSVTDASTIVLTIAATASSGGGGVTLTFNPMLELGGPASVAGTVSSTTTFTATTGYPFLLDVVGSRVYIPGTPGVLVTGVSGQDGTTRHYNVVTLDTALSNGAATLVFAQGCVQTLSNATGDMLDLGQYGNSYFVWTANNEMRRVSWRPRSSTTGVEYRDLLTSRPTGLLPVVTQPTVTSATNGSYTWPVSLGAGYYWVLCTEIWDPDNTVDAVGKEEIESAYLGQKQSTKLKGVPVAVNVPETSGYGITVTLPRRVNNGADGRISNYWGVYMYGPTDDDVTLPSLAAFRRVRKVAMDSGADGGTQTVTLAETATAPDAQYSNGSAAVSGFSQFTNPSRMAAGAAGYADGSFATAQSSGGATLKANTLTFPAFSTAGTVVGIRVTLRARSTSGYRAGYAIQLQSGSKKSDLIWAEAVSGFPHDYQHGGDSDNWGVTWSAPSDFASGTFKVLIMKGPSNDTQVLNVDGVKVQIFYSTATMNLNGVPFRVVTYTDQIGDTINEPARGVAPTCNTGDLFQGSLVVNDLADETAIRFSLPGEPESFPSPYVMRFNTTKRRDRVTLIRQLNDVLVLGFENAIRALRYLPTETTTDLRGPIAHIPIATDHGIPGPLAAVAFDWPGRGSALAYASLAGVFVTDGLKTTPLNMDLDWPNTIKLSTLSTCVFRVYPREKWLVLYYCPAGATHNRNTRALIFSYAADKVKDDEQLPAVGPITVSGLSSTEVVLSGYFYVLTGHETDGFIYQEDYGVAQASGYQVHNAAGTLASAPIVPFVRLRRMYPAGITHDCHLYKAYLLLSLYGSTSTVTATTTAGSTTVTSSAAFVSADVGKRIKMSGLDEGTIITAFGTASSVTVSRAANASGSATATLDDGTIAVTDRGASIGESATAGMHTVWGSSLASDMIVVHLDDTRQGLELQVEKVPLTFTTNVDGYRYDTATWADLGVNMRLHQAMILFDDQGPEQTRSTV